MFLMCFVECHMLISIVLSLDVTSKVLSLACFALSLNMIQMYIDFFKIVHIILKTWQPYFSYQLFFLCMQCTYLNWISKVWKFPLISAFHHKIAKGKQATRFFLLIFSFLACVPNLIKGDIQSMGISLKFPVRFLKFPVDNVRESAGKITPCNK